MHENKLIGQTSPYLLQHAHQPVDWYPWGDEAFEKAAREDKPVFLSIGYSTCHWCHVMAHESFDDENVARLMNQRYVSIKVDREERPDVDSVYMSVCQAMTGSGGWPMTVFLDHDGAPFYCGTYFPKVSRGRMPSFTQLCRSVDDAWRHRRVWLHTLGSAGADTLLLSEPDERFWLGVDDSRDRTKVLIASESKQTSEYWLLDVTDPDAGLRVVAPRREGLEYSVEVGTDGLYIVHNDGATDFELAVAPFTATGAHDWQPLVPQRPGVRLLGVDAYADYLVLSSRSQALPLIEVLTRLPDGTWGDPVPIGFD